MEENKKQMRWAWRNGRAGGGAFARLHGGVVGAHAHDVASSTPGNCSLRTQPRGKESYTQSPGGNIMDVPSIMLVLILLLQLLLFGYPG